MRRFDKRQAAELGWAIHEAAGGYRGEKYVDIPGRSAELVNEYAEDLSTLLNRIRLYEEHAAKVGIKSPPPAPEVKIPPQGSGQQDHSTIGREDGPAPEPQHDDNVIVGEDENGPVVVSSTEFAKRDSPVEPLWEVATEDEVEAEPEHVAVEE